LFAGAAIVGAEVGQATALRADTAHTSAATSTLRTNNFMETPLIEWTVQYEGRLRARQ
jgi:hypothetical protein